MSKGEGCVELSFETRVRAPRDVLVSELDGEAVLLKLQSESYFGLDEIGTRIWQLLLSSESIQVAYETLLSEFDVEPDTLRIHLTELLDSLFKQGLIEVAPR